MEIRNINISKSEAGGKEVTFSVNGDNIYSYLKYESGATEFKESQTETQGRVHTSAATVAVLPEAEDADVEIKEFIYELMR